MLRVLFTREHVPTSECHVCIYESANCSFAPNGTIPPRLLKIAIITALETIEGLYFLKTAYFQYMILEDVVPGR
jgi:hypothetical protein